MKDNVGNSDGDVIGWYEIVQDADGTLEYGEIWVDGVEGVLFGPVERNDNAK